MYLLLESRFCFAKRFFIVKIMEYFRERKYRTFLIFFRAKNISVNLFYRSPFFTEKKSTFFQTKFSTDSKES